ncbi:unnamed protein product [marine sediment metagenome]|uniref:Uncharacterized protein n=1 Tax=marine sediment metagenome TaxID=412755 RepID=X1G655_9ZZZZ
MKPIVLSNICPSCKKKTRWFQDIREVEATPDSCILWHRSCYDEEHKMKLTEKQKVFLAEYFNSIGGVDEDGYFGHYGLPEDILKIYTELFPEEWD